MNANLFALMIFLLIGTADLSLAQQGNDEQRQFQEVRSKAEQGDANAQYSLGYVYEKGEIIPRNTEESMKWYRKAFEQIRKSAKAGDANAQEKLGRMYANGLGISKDAAEALTWYRKAAAAGNKVAQHYLADALISDEGIANRAEAVEWLKRILEN